MSDREKLINLIEKYLEKQITTENFSDNYVLIWRELYEEDRRSKKEEEQFNELGEVVARYSPFEEELIKYDSVYFSGEDVYRTAKKVYGIIKKI